MTTNIFSVLNTAKVGLLSQQLGIEVTGQNIANVQTKGFSRQRVVLEASPPRMTGLGLLGTGVKVSSIVRSHDKFLFDEIVSETNPLGEFTLKKDVFDQLEALFNENNGRSLNSALSDFFDNFHDISANPRGLAERATAVAKAESMLDVFRQIGNSLFQKQLNLDQQVIDEVTFINTIVGEIAELNRSIHANEPGPFIANDLRDKRDILVKELSEKMDLNFFTDQEGTVNLTFSDGTPLLIDATQFTLSTQLNGDNLGFKDIIATDAQGNTVNVTSLVQGGKMKGLLDMRDVELPAFLDQLDRLALGLSQEVNRIHEQGFGLDGSTGLLFFTTLAPIVRNNTANTGSAQVSMTNASPTTTSVDKFEMEFTSGNTFILNNQTTGLASGTFTFSAGSTFNLANGFAVTITGAAAAGDRFTFSVSENASRTLAVSDIIKNNHLKIAAGKTTNGDGDNALELANLQDSLVFDNTSLKAGSGSFTFDEFYNSLIGVVGVKAQSEQTGLTQQEAILLQLQNRKESKAGVSIDEELINMIKFQQAYNAAARLITAVDEMMTILQNSV